jgi:guanylate kinase
MSRVFIISAPSGSGKSTLVKRLLAHDRNLIFSTSYTTRTPRGTERNGEHYVFISPQEFEERIGRGEFLEWALVFGHYYGTHRGILERGRSEGKDVVLDIDVQGARQLKQKIPDAVSIFILAPSREELAKRLRTRSEDSEEVILQRLAGAAGEIEDFRRYDYVLVNDDVDAASERLQAIVNAERSGATDPVVEALRRANPAVTERVERILDTFRVQEA